MFNLYTFEKQLKEAKQFKQLKQSYLHESTNHQKQLNEMKNRYRKRIENFTSQVAEHPIKSKLYLPPLQFILREDFKYKFDKRPKFVIPMKYHHKPDYETKSQIFTTNDSFVTGANSQRNQSPQPFMKFKDLTSLDRFQSKLLHNDNKYLQNDEFRQNKKNIRKLVEEAQSSHDDSIEEKKKQQSQLIVKNIYPELHKKTYFRAVEEVSNLLPFVSISNQPKPQSFMTRVSQDLEQQQNVSYNSRQVLIKCNQAREKYQKQQ